MFRSTKSTNAVLGITVPQEKSFWGAPWVMSLMGRGR